MVPRDVIIIIIIIITDREVEKCLNGDQPHCHNFSSNIPDPQRIRLTLGLFKVLND